ncbi:uncharacterized protein LOC125541695 [Triticum urartu]|uniref:uncharacterized protein LOC125541695 n=1 Tax=Triticum urartu TaxID=4572 RepID=UPI0020444A7D|nr:uncharacterized protein LOC125541695 [Triticum urartu]
MPQLDLESLFCVGGGESRSTKVACETIASDVDVANAHEQSRRLIWAWSGPTGAALERDGSTKGGSNPKTAAEETARNKGASRAPRRLELEAIVVGVLPAGKMVVQQRRPPVVGRGWRRPAAGARVFASEAVGTEPASPKVSCFGAVRSESRAAAPAPAAPRGEEEQVEERSGCWASVASALRDLLCGSDSDDRQEGESGASESKPAVSGSPTVSGPVLLPPRPVLGLGDVKQIASRRWPDGDGRCLV